VAVARPLEVTLDPAFDEEAGDLRGDCVGGDYFGSDVAQLLPVAPGSASQELEALVDRQVEANRQYAFRLFDHDARVQSLLKLCAAAGEDARQLDESLDGDPGLCRGSRREGDAQEAVARRYIGPAGRARLTLRAADRQAV
jgi:hypothetical protein